jgi:hypothetical protein
MDLVESAQIVVATVAKLNDMKSRSLEAAMKLQEVKEYLEKFTEADSLHAEMLGLVNITESHMVDAEALMELLGAAARGE